MAMDKYSELKLTFDEITGAMKFTGQQATSLQKQFRLLKQELTLGSYTEEQFTQIRNALQEVEIKLKQSQIRGKEFFEQIGTLGGPIGELSNRVSRAISLFAALNEMSFDELKSQFENISKILSGSVEDISAGISVVKSGGRPTGTRESTGNVGEAGQGLRTADNANTVANVANAVAISKVSEATEKLTKDTVAQTIAANKLSKSTVEEAMASGNYTLQITNLDAATTKLLLTEEARNKRQQSFIGQTTAQKRILLQQYAEEDAALNKAGASMAAQILNNQELNKQKKLLEASLKDVNIEIAQNALWIEIENGEYRKLTLTELELIGTNSALIVSTEGLIVTQEANNIAIAKNIAAKELQIGINKVFNAVLNTGRLLAIGYNAATTAITKGLGLMGTTAKVVTFTVRTLSLALAGIAGAGIAAVLVGLYQLVTGFAKSSAAAENLKVELENLNQVLDLNLGAIKRRNAEELAEMKVKNATSEEIRKKEIKAAKESQLEIAEQLKQAKILEAKALGDFEPARLALRDRFLMEQELYSENNEKMKGFTKQQILSLANDARKLYNEQLAQLEKDRKNYDGSPIFGLTEDAAAQQAENIKKSGTLLLSLQEKNAEAVIDINVKGNADIEATERNRINNRIKAIDAQMEQEIESTKTSSKELIRLYKERNKLVDYLDKDHKLTLVERAERTRIQNLKINNSIIDDNVRVIQAEIDANQRLVDETGKGTEEQFKARREIAQQMFNKEMEEAKKDEKTRANNEKNARTKFYKDSRQIDIDELTAKEDLQQTFLNGSVKGIESYFDEQVNLEKASYEKRQAEFSLNTEKLEALEKEHTQKLQDIQVQRLASREDLIQHFLNAESENTVQYFKLQRDLENASYVKQQEAAKGNYQLLEGLRLEHLRKMDLIDSSEFENKARMLDRQSKTEFQDKKNKDDYTIASLFDKNNVLRTINEKAYQDQVASENANFEAQKIKAGTNKEQLVQIDLEHLQVLRDLGAQKIETEQQVNLMIEQLGVEFGTTLSTIGNALLQDAQGRDEKKFKAAKKMAIAGIGIEKASAIASIWTNNYIANAKARATFWATNGQPFVTINTISAILNTAATIAAAAQAMSAINGTDFQSPDKGSGRHYASGGMIDGARHSDGGVPIEAEGGEAIMTRGAVTAFAPLLSMLNVAGGGTSFSQGAVGQAGYDNPTRDGQQFQQSQITKTYVVEQELTTMQQRQARLKNLSTL